MKTINGMMSILLVLAFGVFAITPLSERASNISTGMSRSDVLAIMGVNPGWIVLRKDGGSLSLKDFPENVAYEFNWENAGTYGYIRVDFNYSGQVCGIDEGRVDLREAKKLMKPSSIYKSSLKDRNYLLKR